MMKNNDVIKVICACFILLASCQSQKKTLRNPSAGAIGTTDQRKQATIPTRPSTISQSGIEYISQYRQIAIDEMHKHGIPASIKLAQGILESGNGNSRLAREANNHFGIKCASEWQGKRIYHDDDAKNDCFRSYATAEESFRDHSRFLLRKRYGKLFTLDPQDYRGWAHGLKEAGYATNPKYAYLLINLIERYELYQYDQPTTFVAEKALEIIGKKPTENRRKKLAVMQIHEVARGETATGIAQKYGLSVQQLLSINSLKSIDLHPGQLLIVTF